MTDKELLSLAAKAAGITGLWVDAGLNTTGNAAPVIWNPLEDDGDALRLAVRLHLEVTAHPALEQTIVHPYYLPGIEHESTEDWEKHADPCAATRRAIVRAAAEIGKTTP